MLAAPAWRAQLKFQCSLCAAGHSQRMEPTGRISCSVYKPAWLYAARAFPPQRSCADGCIPERTLPESQTCATPPVGTPCFARRSHLSHEIHTEHPPEGWSEVFLTCMETH